jgi:signal transduction histidine kinase
MCIKCASSIKNLGEKARVFTSLLSRVKPDEMVDIPVFSMVNRTLGSCDDMIAGKRIDCQNRIDPALMVHAVPDQVRELFFNLISNAIQFSYENGVIIIAVEQQGGTPVISVQDFGIGLAPAHLDHIFDEFFKVDESRHDIGAPGLGLSICKRIVQNYHGRIWAESAGQGKGTTIRFTLEKQGDRGWKTGKEVA